MAIDWKTIISEFDGKPTLLQAIGKLRKAVEDETITIQQAQAEIAKLESQQKADEALITRAQSTADEAKINAYNASQKGDQALGKATTADTKAQAADTKAQAADTKAQNAQSAAQAADTKAQQALDLATTNETNLSNKQNKIYAHHVIFSAEFGTLYSDENIQALIYTSSSTPFTFNDFYNYVYSNSIPVFGKVLDGNDYNTVIGFPIVMFAINSKLYLYWFKFSENNIAQESVTSETCYINDTVTEV